MAAVQPEWRSRAAVPALLVGLVATVWLFHTLGAGQLEAPPLRPSGWSSWADSRDPLVATMAILRSVVLALSWYLLVATLLGTLARLLRSPRLVAAADAVTLPALRRFLRTTLGVSLATAMIVTAPPVVRHDAGRAAAASVDDPRPWVRAQEVDLTPDDATETLPGTSIPLPLELATDPLEPDGPSARADADAQVPAWSQRSRPVERVGPPRTPAAAHGEVAMPLPDAARPDTRPAALRTRTVVPGDSLWSIARDVLVSGGHGEPSEPAIAAYWRELIAVNRAVLADPDDPDLIFPGDDVRLPPVPDDLGVQP